MPTSFAVAQGLDKSASSITFLAHGAMVSMFGAAIAWNTDDATLNKVAMASFFALSGLKLLQISSKAYRYCRSNLNTHCPTITSILFSTFSALLFLGSALIAKGIGVTNLLAMTEDQQNIVLPFMLASYIVMALEDLVTAGTRCALVEDGSTIAAARVEAAAHVIATGADFFLVVALGNVLGSANGKYGFANQVSYGWNEAESLIPNVGLGVTALMAAAGYGVSALLSSGTAVSGCATSTATLAVSYAHRQIIFEAWRNHPQQPRRRRRRALRSSRSAPRATRASARGLLATTHEQQQQSQTTVTKEEAVALPEVAYATQIQVVYEPPSLS